MLDQVKVLAPIGTKEIVYRLSTSAQGVRLGRLIAAQGNAAPHLESDRASTRTFRRAVKS
jgi:hypothetical protein